MTIAGWLLGRFDEEEVLLFPNRRQIRIAGGFPAVCRDRSEADGIG